MWCRRADAGSDDGRGYQPTVGELRAWAAGAHRSLDLTFVS